MIKISVVGLGQMGVNHLNNLANIKNRQEVLILPMDTLESLKELAAQANLIKALPTELQDE